MQLMGSNLLKLGAHLLMTNLPEIVRQIHVVLVITRAWVNAQSPPTLNRVTYHFILEVVIN